MLDSTFNGYPIHLIENWDETKHIKEHLYPDTLVGISVKTESLSWVEGENHVVGVCVSCGKSYDKQDYHSYYLPIRHQYGYTNNLPVDKTINLIQWLVDNVNTVFWNRSQDVSILELDGFKMPFIGKTNDAQIMAYLVNQESTPALGDCASKYLHLNVVHFEDNSSNSKHFGLTDPTLTYVYAAQDSLITVLLAKHIWTTYSYIRHIYNVDNHSAESLRWFAKHSVVPIDKEMVRREMDKVTQEMQTVKQQIFALCGYEFRLTSKADKVDAMRRFVTLTQKGADGTYSLDKDVLSRIDHPLARLFDTYNQLERYRGSYLTKMLDFDDKGIHVCYGTCTTSTGRLSSGEQRGNSYFAPFNIQNVKKVEVMRYVHTDNTLGYIINDEPEGAVCMMKVKGGLRDAFPCPEGFVWMASDYSSEELRVAANLSGEPNLINPMLEGKDIHTHVAEQMFGFTDKYHRTKVKTLNFMVIYGGSAGALARKLNISLDEAKRLLDTYNTTMSKLTEWKHNQIESARKNGIVYTFFGRPRTVYNFYTSSDKSMHSYGDRTAVNSPVQGFGGDLIRIDFIKLRKLFESDHEFADNVRLLLTVHDEIDIAVRPHYLKQAYTKLTGIMDYTHPEFRVPIVSSPSVGIHWGVQVDCVGISNNNHILIDRTKCVPLDGQREEDMYAVINEWENQPNY